MKCAMYCNLILQSPVFFHECVVCRGTVYDGSQQYNLYLFRLATFEGGGSIVNSYIVIEPTAPASTVKYIYMGGGGVHISMH